MTQSQAGVISQIKIVKSFSFWSAQANFIARVEMLSFGKTVIYMEATILSNYGQQTKMKRYVVFV